MTITTTARAYDVFNGDADGLCALHQLRLAQPRQAHLITGVKRDICLLHQISARRDDQITVLDISLDANAYSLKEHLEAGAQVDYFDHHGAALRFEHPGLTLHWDEAPDVCTSMLVNRQLNGRYAAWASVAAFGDNMAGPAARLADEAGIDQARQVQLRELGTLLNYNAYGETVADLVVAPAALYQDLHAYHCPFDFIANSPNYSRLREAHASDVARLADIEPGWQQSQGAIYILPDRPWARRMSGLLANRLKEQARDKSIAVLTENADGSFVVSVRSAHPEHKSANGFCVGFPSGGGRRSAAGINGLQAAQLPVFVERFFSYF